MEGLRAPDPLQYPFDVPDGPYIWHCGVREEIDAAHLEDPFELRVAGRVPVLAIGSNSSPSQLSRKFTDPSFNDPKSPDSRILVYRARVPDMDIVYAAHIASYGSLPATIMSKPGCIS